MTTVMFRMIAGATAVAAAAALAGCSAATKEDRPAASSPNQSAGAHAADTHDADTHDADTHNADDVMFAQMMIPHHEQAVELSALVPGRSTDPAVVKLAAAISGEQQPEIDFMKSTLAQWGVDPGQMDHGGGQHGTAMAGMVDEATMDRLEALKGEAFDTLWLQSMIAHHRGAIEMAKAEVEAGSNPEMTALARSISTAQQAEIDEMNQMVGG